MPALLDEQAVCTALAEPAIWPDFSQTAGMVGLTKSTLSKRANAGQIEYQVLGLGRGRHVLSPWWNVLLSSSLHASILNRVQSAGPSCVSWMRKLPLTLSPRRARKASRILTLDPAMCPPGCLKLRNSVRTPQLSLVVFPSSRRVTALGSSA